MPVGSRRARGREVSCLLGGVKSTDAPLAGGAVTPTVGNPLEGVAQRRVSTVFQTRGAA